MRCRAAVLFEVLITIAVIGVLFEITMTGLELLDPRRYSGEQSQRVDGVAERLRADLRTGGTLQDEQLITGGHVWTVRSGYLERNNIAQCAGDWTIHPSEHGLIIELRPVGAQPRRILIGSVP